MNAEDYRLAALGDADAQVRVADYRYTTPSGVTTLERAIPLISREAGTTDRPLFTASALIWNMVTASHHRPRFWVV